MARRGQRKRRLRPCLLCISSVVSIQFVRNIKERRHATLAQRCRRFARVFVYIPRLRRWLNWLNHIRIQPVLKYSIAFLRDTLLFFVFDIMLSSWFLMLKNPGVRLKVCLKCFCTENNTMFYFYFQVVLGFVACASAQYAEERAPRYIASSSEPKNTPAPPVAILKQINR